MAAISPPHDLESAELHRSKPSPPAPAHHYHSLTSKASPQLPTQEMPPSPPSSGSSSCPAGPLPLSPEILTKDQILRLGRQRPSALPSAIFEFTYITTVVLSMMMSEFFISGFNIVLPSVASALDIPSTERTWPAAVPNLTTAALLLPFSRLCDCYGAKKVFLGGHLWLLLWSVVSGFSPTPIVLIICRAMQGIGFAAFLPAGLTLLGQTYRPGPRKNLVYCIYGAFAVIGFYFGIVIGAVAAKWLDWRWYFWIGAITEFFVVVMGFLTIPKSLSIIDPDAKMDWWGVATIVPGLVLVVYAFTDGGNAPQGWKTPYIYVTLVLGLVFLAAAVYVQGWVSAQPLVPAALFKPKYFKRLFAGLFCAYGVFGIFLFYASYHIESVLRTEPLQTAAWFSPLAVGGIILALSGGFVLHLVPNRILMTISGLGFLLSVLLFALQPEQTPDSGLTTSKLYWAWIFPAMCCGTIGVDITFNITNVFITTAMPQNLQAAASGLINSLLYLGIAFWLGIAELAVSATLQGRGGADSISPREQYRIGFWTGVALAVIALCLTVTVKMGQAEADMTADEKAEMAKRQREMEQEEC